MIRREFSDNLYNRRLYNNKNIFHNLFFPKYSYKRFKTISNEVLKMSNTKGHSVYINTVHSSWRSKLRGLSKMEKICFSVFEGNNRLVVDDLLEKLPKRVMINPDILHTVSNINQSWCAREGFGVNSSKSYSCYA